MNEPIAWEHKCSSANSSNVYVIFPHIAAYVEVRFATQGEVMGKLLIGEGTLATSGLHYVRTIFGGNESSPQVQAAGGWILLNGGRNNTRPEYTFHLSLTRDNRSSFRAPNRHHVHGTISAERRNASGTSQRFVRCVSFACPRHTPASSPSLDGSLPRW